MERNISIPIIEADQTDYNRLNNAPKRNTPATALHPSMGEVSTTYNDATIDLFDMTRGVIVRYNIDELDYFSTKK